MKTLTLEDQSKITPIHAIDILKKGNARFMEKRTHDRDHMDQVNSTSNGQYPFATILSCIDSRVPAELVFDQGIGDMFSIRIAGNFINQDILGSMEFACKLAGTKVIVVLGHTSCGAVKGACDGAKLGNLTAMLNNIMPAVTDTIEPKDSSKRNSANIQFVNTVSKRNVELSIERIRRESEVLVEMEKKGEIIIVGGMYNIEDGSVTFYD